MTRVSHGQFAARRTQADPAPWTRRVSRNISHDQGRLGVVPPRTRKGTAQDAFHKVKNLVEQSDGRKRLEFDCSVPRSAKELVESQWFSTVIYVVIIFNTLQMGVELDVTPTEGSDAVFFVLEMIVTTTFFLEMVLKIAVFKLGYFHDRWNVLDFVIVAVSLADLVLTVVSAGSGNLRILSLLRVLRLFRLLRLIKLIRKFKKFTLLLQGIADAFRTMTWVALLLVILLYACSILCVEVIGKSEGLYYRSGTADADLDDMEVFNQFNSFVFFGSVGRSMYTLFCITVLAEYSEVARPIGETQPAMLLFVFFFTCVTTFGIMNVIIGVIVDSTMEASRVLTDELSRTNLMIQHDRVVEVQKVVFSMNNGVKTVSQDIIRDAFEGDLVLLRGLNAGVYKEGELVTQEASRALGVIRFTTDARSEEDGMVEVYVDLQVGRFDPSEVFIGGRSAGCPVGGVLNIKDLFESLEVPPDFTADDLFRLLDRDGNGAITKNEFKNAMFTVIAKDEYQSMCYEIVQRNRILHVVDRLAEGLKTILSMAKAMEDAHKADQSGVISAPLSRSTSRAPSIQVAVPIGSSKPDLQELKATLREVVPDILRPILGNYFRSQLSEVDWIQHKPGELHKVPPLVGQVGDSLRV
mmetsp:Transcript_14142/g.34644  ORF Transcript_14142/g.34644 Transcript_14142/m.34644 type:complete len:637 (+) Transcript_14142:3-1913(+)